MHTVATYAIYWDPQDYYHGDWQGSIDGFLANMGSAGGKLDNVFAMDTQYTDRTNQPATSGSSFHGAYVDTNPYPQSEGCTDPHPLESGMPLLESGLSVCLTNKQVRTQLETFIGEQHGLRKGMGTIFYLLTPPGVTVCLDAGGATGHCSDFSGNPTEVSNYEEEVATYPARLAKYEEEKKEYEKALEEYEEEKTQLEKESKPDNARPPVDPKRPAAPKLPASYASYTKSFCSYHAAVSPTDPANGDGNTILYAVIPWTAGGAGDHDLSLEDRTQAPACQDGGFQPSTKPGGELEEKERVKSRTPLEQEEFEKKTPREQREEEEAKEQGLEKPHDQEPNQIGLGPDGSYDTGLADLIINQIAVEQQDTVTNPLLNAWQDSAGQEMTDECRNSFFLATGSASASPLTQAGTLSNQSLAGHGYYLNDGFNLASTRLSAGVPCRNNISLEPKFTAPNPVNSGEIVGFDGMESDITLDSGIDFTQNGAPQTKYGTFTWNFGDGSAPVTGFAPGSPSANSPAASPCAAPWEAPCAASTYHSYQYGGTYTVTLTITDIGGNTGSVSEPITVERPVPALASPRWRIGRWRGRSREHDDGRLVFFGLSWLIGLDHRHNVDCPGSRCHRNRDHHIPEKGLEQRSPRPLHRQRAGGRQHRGAARKLSRQAAWCSRRDGDRPAEGHSQLDCGGHRGARHDKGRSRHAPRQVLQPYVGASEARSQTEADAAPVCPQRFAPESSDDDSSEHRRPEPLIDALGRLAQAERRKEVDQCGSECAKRVGWPVTAPAGGAPHTPPKTAGRPTSATRTARCDRRCRTRHRPRP